MMKRIYLAATAAMMTAAPAFADAGDTQLQHIAETVCAANQKVIFLPVSHDQMKLRASFAVLPADNLMENGVDIVTASERTWLEQNGCNGPTTTDMMVSKDADTSQNAS
jgi:hypothetical protein